MKITLSLIVINVLIFLYIPSTEFLESFAFSINNFLSGKYYILITSMFLHANLLHMINNMVALFLLGWAIEKKVKGWQYILVYFLGGIFGNLAMFFFYSPDTLAVGASAAISALIGLGTFVCPGKLVMFPAVIPIPFVVAGAIYFLSTSSLLFAASNIAYPAHLAGLIVGASFGLIWGGNRIKSMIIFISISLLIILLPYIIPLILKMNK